MRHVAVARTELYFVIFRTPIGGEKITGWDQKMDPGRLNARILKIPAPICMILDILRLHFCLTHLFFIKFITNEAHATAW